MKRILRITIMAMFFVGMFFLSSCGSYSPEACIENFCSALKSFDFVSMKECFSEGRFDEEGFSGIDGCVYDFVKECARKLEYTVTGEKITGDTAIVSVSFKYADCSEAILKAFDLYLEKVSGINPEEKADLLEDSLKAAKEQIGLSAESVSSEFILHKVNQDWVMDDIPENVIPIVTSGYSKLGL